MHIFLYILWGLAFLAGLVLLGEAKSAIHEIEAFMLFLISTVLLTGASVVEAINFARTKIEALVQIPADVRKAAPPAQPAPAPPPQPVTPAPPTLRFPVLPMKSSAPPPLPVTPAPPASRPYFFSADGKDSGPHSLDEMRRFHKSGKLTDETLVIRQGDADWQPATMFPEICFER